MTTNFVIKLSFVVPAFRNGLNDRKSGLRILNGNDLCITFTNFMTFGPVTPEMTRVEIATFASIAKN